MRFFEMNTMAYNSVVAVARRATGSARFREDNAGGDFVCAMSPAPSVRGLPLRRTLTSDAIF
jgi:hypothetical protein